MPIAIAAPASGSGKTTITLALLAALRHRGLQAQSFKVGPDYIDPMFHEAATGLPCRTLDPFLTSENYVRRCFHHHAARKQAVIVEGVMGLFDGKADGGDFASTAHVAKLLGIPIVLVIDAQKVGRTVAAIAYGLVHFDPNLTVAGIIFNRVGSDRHAQLLREAIAPLRIPILGIVRTDPDIHMPSRHLGLIPIHEQDSVPPLLARLAHLAEHSFHWDQLLPHLSPTSQAAALWPQLDSTGPPLTAPPPRIAIARDAAFNFYYADNLDLLQSLGARLEYFSPLEQGLNPCLNCDGLYLGGGFPEVFAAQLSEEFQRQPIDPSRLPTTYAECGGLMVLGDRLTDRNGHSYPMTGLMPYSTTLTRKLTLGYRAAQVIAPSPAVKPGDLLRGHEFHHSSCHPAASPGVYAWGEHREGWSSPLIHASYLHLHWGAQPHVARRWLQSCQHRCVTIEGGNLR